MNPLPAIINVLEEVKVDQVPVFNGIANVVKKFVLCITRDLEKEHHALLKNYTVVEYDDTIHKNIPIQNYAWDFLILDLREKGDRYCYMKEVAPSRLLYNVIVYCHGFEMDEVDISYDNAFSKFPTQQATKEDFEKLLMMKRIRKPRCYVSLFSCLLNYYHKAKN